MREVRRFLAYMGKYRLRYWLILITTLLMESALQILYSYATKQTLNAVENRNREMLQTAVFICVIVVILKCLFPYLRYFEIRLVRRIIFGIKLNLFSKLLRMDMTYFGSTHSAEALKTLNWDVNSLKDAWFSHVYWVLGKIVLVISSITAMMVYSPVLTLISLFISGVTVLLSVRINNLIKKHAKEVQVKTGKLATYMSNILAGFVTLKMEPGAGIVLAGFDRENRECFRQEGKRVHMAALLEMAAFVLGIMGSFGTIIAGALLVAGGRLDYGTVMAVVTLQMGVSASMQRFGGALSTFTTSLVRAGHVFDFLELDGEEIVTGRTEESRDSEQEKSGTGRNSDGSPCAESLRMEEVITIRDLHFSYDGGGNLLRGWGFFIGKGEKLALVGKSGCGKSTLLKLLLGFYPAQDNQIFLYGRELKDYSLGQLRDMIAYMPQECYLFGGTIAENIAYGSKAPEDVGRDEIVRAAQMACADEFIADLPKGYETPLLPGGRNLSVGQRQRIALARAFCKDAPIVLLDEPFSALDAHSEQIIRRAVASQMKDKTVIMVTHRMTDAELFDRVIRL